MFLEIVFSQFVDVDQLLSHVHKNVDHERFGRTQKYEEDVRVLYSDSDGPDVRHPILDVLDVYDNSHISFFIARTYLWYPFRQCLLTSFNVFSN